MESVFDVWSMTVAYKQLDCSHCIIELVGYSCSNVDKQACAVTSVHIYDNDTNQLPYMGRIKRFLPQNNGRNKCYECNKVNIIDWMVQQSVWKRQVVNLFHTEIQTF